jgi:GNAT superfamily N-acetyltransferase
MRFGKLYTIINSGKAPHHLPRLRQWFIENWGRVDNFDSALLAVKGDELLGGLVFTTYPLPDNDEQGLWINALYIAPEYRGEGLATRLIQRSEKEAVTLGYNELFVFSDVPQLYLKSGWLLIDDSGRTKVLKKKLF